MDWEMDIEQLTTMIEKIHTVSGVDICCVLYGLVVVAVQQLDQGRIVRLGDLWSLRASLSSEGNPTEEELNAGSIKKVHIIFTPGTKKDMMKTVRFALRRPPYLRGRRSPSSAMTYESQFHAQEIKSGAHGIFFCA